MAFLPATGIRPQEVRLARLKDLELPKRRILVAHPKGEGSWAAPDYGARPLVGLRGRRGFPRGPRDVPRKQGVRVARALRCGVRDKPEACLVENGYGPWSAAMLRKLKADLGRRSRVVFSLKTFLATFAQRAIDGGARIDAVARAMRHRSTKTTEAYYARIRSDDAFHEIEKALERPWVRLKERVGCATIPEVYRAYGESAQGRRRS